MSNEFKMSKDAVRDFEIFMANIHGKMMEDLSIEEAGKQWIDFCLLVFGRTVQKASYAISAYTNKSASYSTELIFSKRFKGAWKEGMDRFVDDMERSKNE